MAPANNRKLSMARIRMVSKSTEPINDFMYIEMEGKYLPSQIINSEHIREISIIPIVVGSFINRTLI
jgi:hypothetical protein